MAQVFLCRILQKSCRYIDINHRITPFFAIFAFIAAMIKLTSKGPLFYKAIRQGFTARNLDVLSSEL